MLGLFANNDLGLDGAVLQMVNHALISSTLFLLAGMVERRTVDRASSRCSAGWRAAARRSRPC